MHRCGSRVTCRYVHAGQRPGRPVFARTAGQTCRKPGWPNVGPAAHVGDRCRFGREVWAVHDWDSLAWQPEAALAGAASGVFVSAGPPTLAPVDRSEAFLVACQNLRGYVFTAVELEVAWAARLWMAAYNAREEALCGDLPVCRDALGAQAANACAGRTPSPTGESGECPLSTTLLSAASMRVIR